MAAENVRLYDNVLRLCTLIECSNIGKRFLEHVIFGSHGGADRSLVLSDSVKQPQIGFKFVSTRWHRVKTFWRCWFVGHYFTNRKTLKSSWKFNGKKQSSLTRSARRQCMQTNLATHQMDMHEVNS